MLPILYTFRRCPYAIRARLAIINSQIEVAMHEVDLRNKPPALLACSPKGTVPVLVLPDGRVIDESLDIMRWALAIHDPGRWLGDSADLTPAMNALIAEVRRNADRAFLFRARMKPDETPEPWPCWSISMMESAFEMSRKMGE